MISRWYLWPGRTAPPERNEIKICNDHTAYSTETGNNSFTNIRKCLSNENNGPESPTVTTRHCFWSGGERRKIFCQDHGNRFRGLVYGDVRGNPARNFLYLPAWHTPVTPVILVTRKTRRRAMLAQSDHSPRTGPDSLERPQGRNCAKTDMISLRARTCAQQCQINFL